MGRGKIANGMNRKGVHGGEYKRLKQMAGSQRLVLSCVLLGLMIGLLSTGFVPVSFDQRGSTDADNLGEIVTLSDTAEELVTQLWKEFDVVDINQRETSVTRRFTDSREEASTPTVFKASFKYVLIELTYVSEGRSALRRPTRESAVERMMRRKVFIQACPVASSRLRADDCKHPDAFKLFKKRLKKYLRGVQQRSIAVSVLATKVLGGGRITTYHRLLSEPVPASPDLYLVRIFGYSKTYKKKLGREYRSTANRESCEILDEELAVLLSPPKSVVVEYSAKGYREEDESRIMDFQECH